MFSEKAKAFLVSEECGSMLYRLRMLELDKRSKLSYRESLLRYLDERDAHNSPEAQSMLQDYVVEIAGLDLRLAELWAELESKLI